MGNCVPCSGRPPVNRQRVLKPMPWEHPEPITRAQLNTMRDQFWAQPRSQRTREIWDVLHAAAESELSIAQTLIDACPSLIVENADLTLCYDDRGVRYELPLYVLSEPTNLIPNN